VLPLGSWPMLRLATELPVMLAELFLLMAAFGLLESLRTKTYLQLLQSISWVLSFKSTTSSLSSKVPCLVFRVMIFFSTLR
jgi:hypothetical protein